MRNKIIGIFVCLLLIATVLPVIGMVGDIENQQIITGDAPSYSIWFVRGTFRYLDEDGEYLYLKAISARLRGFGNGASIYRLFGCSIKIAKPFYGFLPEVSLPMPGIGICREWDYV
jgi:hypothetical protein